MTLKSYFSIDEKIRIICRELDHAMFLTTERKNILLRELALLQKQLVNLKQVLSNEKKNN